MITLPEPPRLVRPTTDVRISYLTGEQADAVASGLDYDWLGRASEDFDGYVGERRRVMTRWGVPSSIYWYVSGPHYLGSLEIRHGGHIGYHVVTRMLTAGVAGPAVVVSHPLGVLHICVDGAYERRSATTLNGRRGRCRVTATTPALVQSASAGLRSSSRLRGCARTAAYRARPRTSRRAVPPRTGSPRSTTSRSCRSRPCPEPTGRRRRIP
jgi:hypothetical protein